MYCVPNSSLIATYYTPSLILVTHCVELAVRMYQTYALKMTLSGLKHVGMTDILNKVVIWKNTSAFVYIYFIYTL
jgi:hypothetical protein